MLTFVFPSFKLFLQRLNRYLQLHDGFNYANPMKLLSMYDRLEESKNCNIDHNCARVGSIVVLQDDNQERFTVVLRKPADAKPELMEISVFSPLGSALLGLEQNQQATVSIAGTQQHFMVAQVINNA
ncbi:MAG: GreA/GreB family elongation factor [Venatoribacter sp.]